MKPITRKELYLNKIVGNNDYSVPEKPISEEELFFAEILGEAVQTPEPLSRYQIYLAKIAGRNISVPKPLTRLELFLAKACGMDIETPTPITREEIFWSNYTAIVEFEVEGVPPLTYKAIEGTLENYRIYGNTVDGESVGDRTANLFDGEFLQGYWAYTNGIRESTSVTWITTSKLPCKPNTDYSFKSSYIGRYFGFVWFDSNGEYISSSCVSDISSNMHVNFSSLSPVDAAYLIINIKAHSNTSTITPSDVTDLMLNEGSTPLPYEPYGYKVPVTVEGKNILPMSTTPISTDIDDFHCEYDGAGTITLTTDKDNAVLNNFSIPLSEDFIIPVSVGQGGNGCVQFNNSIATSVNSNTDHMAVDFLYNNTFIDGWRLTTINRIHSTYVSMGGKTINRMVIDIQGTGFSTNRKIVIRPAFVLNTTEQVPFEPYHAPVTTPIYLPEQIRKVGDEAEYIDYASQKMHRIGAEDIDVTLPELPTLAGTNVLAVGTAVQPSKVYIKGQKEREYT